MQVIDVSPVNVGALRSQAIGVDGGMDSPGVDFLQREVLVNKLDQALVVVDGGGEEGLVHAGAITALQVVEVDDRDLGIGISADRAVGDVDVEGGILHQVEGFQARQLGVVGRD